MTDDYFPLPINYISSLAQQILDTIAIDYFCFIPS